MASAISRNRYLLIPGTILVLAIIALGAIQLGKPANFVDPYGLLFILVGGVALVLISFPGVEIRRALWDAAGIHGNEADLRGSSIFWEAAGRGFWILGVLCGVIYLTIGFTALATEPNGLRLIIGKMAQSLLAAFYGILLAVLCFIPCWKLRGKLLGQRVEPDAGKRPMPAGRDRRWFSSAIGYVLFFSALASFLTSQILNISMPIFLWIGYRPAMLVVLGGTIALMLFMGGTNSGPTLSTAFAGVGLIGCLMGCIQMLFGMTLDGAIAHVAGALAFILSSSLTALLGMALIGAPLEDRTFRIGRITAPSAFSRVSWYVFPLLALIFLALAFVIMIIPLYPPR
jgi:hypothetical protein